MKIDRLIGILSILLQNDKVTAPVLAEKFEVSRRTINRDIEDICKAGIPLVTEQGRNGGISIMEGYRLDRTLLTSADMQDILAGLKSLDSVSGTRRYQQLMDKLSLGSSSVLAAGGHILIDLSSWQKSSLSLKIEQIQAAIERHEKIRFLYYSPKGESRREVEPYFLIFKWSSWYVWGYCAEREEYRMFKLNRMVDLAASGEFFCPREIPPVQIEGGEIYPPKIYASVILDSDLKWCLIDGYGNGSFTELEDGRLLLNGGFADKDSLFGWVLSFGGRAELTEPEDLRVELKQIIEGMMDKYTFSTKFV